MTETDFLDYALTHHFGDLHFKVDKATGMKAIIAIHSTKLGPALGGLRCISYANTQEAIHDAMRLAQGMSYKAASVNLPLGGGKAVIIAPNTGFDRVAYMRAFGNFVQELGGRYITAVDSGTSLEDMDIIGQKTPYVASLSQAHGDPSPYTAQGVLQGIKAAVAFQLGKSSLQGLQIAIQGLGHVGLSLARSLQKEGAILHVADINVQQVAICTQELGATAVAVDKIHAIASDVFCPCALGAIINDTTIEELQAPIVAGAANNQLAYSYHGERLREKGILYAPDYIINAGGLIFAASKYLHTKEAQIMQNIENIQEILLQIFETAKQENLAPITIANRLAQEKLR
jgi:leucine dehydrogenase